MSLFTQTSPAIHQLASQQTSLDGAVSAHWMPVKAVIGEWRISGQCERRLWPINRSTRWLHRRPLTHLHPPTSNAFPPLCWWRPIADICLSEHCSWPTSLMNPYPSALRLP